MSQILRFEKIEQKEKRTKRINDLSIKGTYRYERVGRGGLPYDITLWTFIKLWCHKVLLFLFDGEKTVEELKAR